MRKQTLYRIVYLILIAAVQYAVRFCIIKPLYAAAGVQIQLTEELFALLTAAVLFLVSGGFFIADYYKEKQSSPHPKGTKRQSEKLYAVFFILSIIGCALGLLVSWKIQFINLSILFIIYASVLYFYALRYRILTFWGNFVIALMAALLTANVWLFEFFALRNNPMELGIVINRFVFPMINTSIALYSGFWFMLVFARQIVKDIIDSPQAPAGSRIFAVRYGIKITRNILAAAVLTLLIMSAVFILYFMKICSHYFLSGGIFMMICELLILFKTMKSSAIENFRSFEYLFEVLVILGIAVLFIR